MAEVAPRFAAGPGSRAQRPQLSDEVATYVRELIMSGQVRPGEYLRLEKLAEQLATSATPVREGLLLLRGEGLVTLKPRKGFVVSPLSGQDILDLFTAQSLLAGELCARAADRIDDARLDRLDEIDRELNRVANSGQTDEIKQLNHQFHRLVNLSADSPKLSWMLSLAAQFAPHSFFENIPGWLEASSTDHVAILAALRAHDAIEARLSMSRHIENAGRLLADNFESYRANGASGG